MKNTCVLLITISALFGCQPNHLINNFSKKSDVNFDDSLFHSVPETYYVDIEYIKSLGAGAITSFNMDSILPPTTFIDNEIVNSSLAKLPVNGHNNWFLKADEYERFGGYQWEESNSYFLFTILQKDESCCLTMYICTALKNGQLISIRQLGVSGSDGGWVGNDWGEKVSFGSFNLFNQSQYDEDIFENDESIGYERQLINTEMLLLFENGSFHVDTIRSQKSSKLVRD